MSGAAGLGSVEDEGFAVNALCDGGVLFVSTDQNAVKDAEIAAAGMICALGNGAGDRMIGLLLFHFGYHPYIYSEFLSES